MEEKEALVQDKQNEPKIILYNDDSFIKNKNIYFLLAFYVELMNSVQNVFLTPYFLVLDTPAYLDSFVWLLPPLISKIVTPKIKRKLQNNIQKHDIHYLLIFQLIMALTGVLIMGNCYYFMNYASDSDYFLMSFGTLGYSLIDLGIVNIEIIYESINFNENNQQKLYVMKQFGRIFGYALGSFLCMGLFNYYINDVFQSNFRFVCFMITIISLFFLIITATFTPYVTKKQDSIFKVENIKKQQFRTLPPQAKIILISYFFSNCAVLQTLMYGTSWVGTMLLINLPKNQPTFLRTRVFDIGVSWGSFTFMFSSILTVICENFFQKFKIKDFQLYIFTQIIGGLSLCCIYNMLKLENTFIVLILSGFQMATTSVIPYQSAKRFCKNPDDQFDRILFYSQVFMFAIFPIIQNIFLSDAESSYQIIINLISGGIFAIISGMVSLFI